MILTIKKNKVSKIIASYLAIQLIVTTVQPSNLFALTGGPSQPEFNSFTPIGTSDMVNLASGDFNYNIPIMDIGGYPINLSYDSGITMDQESSWVGLGWNLNVGQINRQVRGIPDDFNGDEIKYENNLKDNKTIGANVQIHPAIVGNDIPVFENGQLVEVLPGEEIGSVTVGLGAEYNNYTGWSFSATQGVSFKMSDNISVGFNMSNSLTSGVSLSPNLKLSSNKFGSGKFQLGTSLGTNFNSRQGLTSLTITPSLTASFNKKLKFKDLQGNESMSFNSSLSSSGTKSFLPVSFTPTKRNSINNESIAANAALGLEVFGGEGQGEIYIYASKQKLNSNEKSSFEKAYGFNFTENASKHDILDFNRENDRTFNKNTNALPVTNYTYDLYSINGQGISGMYQPYRSQVGYVFDKFVKDESKDNQLGIEVGASAYVHIGVEFKSSPSESYTGLWSNGNNARSNFTSATSNNESYEKVFYKPIGELNVDNEITLLNEQLGGEEPIELALINSNRNKQTKTGSYIGGTTEPLSPLTSFISGKINRNERVLRNQSIQTFNKKDLNILHENYVENKPHISEEAKDHHNLETRITQPDGSVYVFGQAAYNTEKIETTFNASTINSYNDCSSNCNNSQELITYSGNDNSPANERGSDNYFNRVTTPGYVHSYLLSEVLSADYEDLTGDGPTDDDLGAYTKIFYNDLNNGDPYQYNWRVPFEQNSATANRGFNSLKKDDMANYIYGKKELFYVSKIVTKTHVAIFEVEERRDGYGVSGENENGGLSANSKMYNLKSISLYSKPEYNLHGSNATPIKKAHFEYDYSLCLGVPNNPDVITDTNGDGIDDQGGKLTLKKLFFTYRNSNMGRFTPYTFNYSEINPEYHIKGYDMWGNYKEPTGNSLSKDAEPTTAEFPYVNQADRNTQDQYAEAWTLKTIGLPSGGKIEMQYEADDYGYIQDKAAMQMYKVRGVGNSPNGNNMNNLLYEGSNSKKYLYIELPEEDYGNFDATNIDIDEYKEKYLGSISLKPIFFKFMLNMKRGDNSAYDYVSGYLKVDNSAGLFNVFANDINESVYMALPVRLVHKNKSRYDDDGENPIAKAGWYFGRKYMNRFVYHEEESNFNVLDIARTIASSVGSYFALFMGPNTELKNMGCAQQFSTSKSWIRLLTPDGIKIGGGLRVSQIAMHDHWDVMTGNDNDELYKMTYGQDYRYNNPDGSSSGVATFEPFGTKENPFIEPYYDDVEKDVLLAPEEENYIEKPFGVSFFPAPAVTYGRVTVSNLNRGTYDNGSSTLEVGNNGTGLVINEFYTSKDFPTITKHTPLGDPNILNFPSGGISIIQSMFGVNFETVKRLSLSQGFTIITNDINGKTKSQKIYKESSLVDGELPNSEITPLSEVKYFYNVNENNKIYNEFPTINDKGEVNINTIGVDYNVVNDFRTSKSVLETYGGDINLAIIPAAIIPIGISSVTPQLAIHDNELRVATTTKVIHKTTFLVEKKAYDLGAEVTTKNIAWDAETGQVLLTQTSNEYSTDNYFNFNYPAYWYYQNMGMASKNIGINLTLDQPSTNNIFTYSNTESSAEDFLTDGDEVLIDNFYRGWVIDVNGDNFSLIDRNGIFIESAVNLKVIRSGYRNLQSASMASVTSMLNPIDLLSDQSFNNNFNDDTYIVPSISDYRIINASAVKYNDLWPFECEYNLPTINYNEIGEVEFVYEGENAFNPYLYNAKGDWRANESYAYLTGRNNIDEGNTRNSGFFNDFSPFYQISENPSGDQIPWVIDETNWTSASMVTKYSPYGIELENKDALDRYSSAQYGYSHKLPVAVASNSEYGEIGFDGFEDYEETAEAVNPHFGFQDVQDVNISSEHAHSGRKSLAVQSSNRVTLRTRIIECEGKTVTPIDDTVIFCYENNPHNFDVDFLFNDHVLGDITSITIVSESACIDATVVDNGTPSNFTDDYINIVRTENSNCEVVVGTVYEVVYEICNYENICGSATIFLTEDGYACATLGN